MRLSSGSLLLALCLSAATLPWARAAADAPPAQTLRDLPEDWYPESLAAGPDGTLYVGSWRQGAVVRLRPDGSAPQVLVTPGSNGLANGQGVLVDDRAGLLWVCSGTTSTCTAARTAANGHRCHDLTAAVAPSWLAPVWSSLTNSEPSFITGKSTGRPRYVLFSTKPVINSSTLAPPLPSGQAT